MTRVWTGGSPRFWAGLGVLWLALALAACGGPQDAETNAAGGEAAAPTETAPTAGPAGDPVRGDWLVLHLLSDPENLNPYTSSDAGAQRVMNWIFQRLLDIDPGSLEQRGQLASGLPEISEDNLTYTFELREDATFSDGKPVTADDVVFSLKTIRHPKVAAPHLRNYFNSVQDAVVQGPHRVRIDLREVYFRNRWTLGAFEVLPRHHYDPENRLEGIGVADLNAWEGLSEEQKARAEAFAKSFNEDFQRNPLGSGAYALVDPKADFVTGERIVLRHVNGNWTGGETDLGDGFVDRVVYRIINDGEAAFVALKAGDLDVVGLTPIQATRGTKTARFRENFDSYSEIRGAYTYIGWNQHRPYFKDKRVRRALSHLVDKQNLVDKVMLGLAKPVEGPIFSERPEYNQALEPWPYDPAKAAALLAEAGWADSDGDGVLDKEIDGKRVPFRFEIISNSGNDERKKVGLTIIDSFKRHGIDASFRSVDWSIMLGKVDKFDFDAVVLGWSSGGAVLPPDVYQIWHSSQAVGGGSNHVAFKNAEADELLEDYRVEFDEARRKELYDRFQEIVYDEQPYTFLYAPESVSAWDRRFAGVVWHPGVGTEYNTWWVPKDRQKY